MSYHDRRFVVVAALREQNPQQDAAPNQYRESFRAACLAQGGESLPGFPKQTKQVGQAPIRLDVYDFGKDGRLALLAAPHANMQAVAFDEVWPDWLHQLAGLNPARKVN
jgi:hypothetical protein